MTDSKNVNIHFKVLFIFSIKISLKGNYAMKNKVKQKREKHALQKAKCTRQMSTVSREDLE